MTSQDPVSRRTMLASVVGGGLLAVAGCAGDGDGSGGATTSTATPTQTPSESSPTTPTTTAGDGTTTGTKTSEPSLPPPTLGPADADVRVDAYEDYLCGHCAHYNLNGLPKIKAEYVEPGTINYRHHDFPVVHDTWSWRSGIAARSVQATVGEDAFWTYAKELFANRGDTSFELYRSLASSVNADPDVVEKHVRDEKWRPVVKADQQRGIERGVRATPTFFVNGNEVDPSGHDSWYGALSDAIESAL